MATSAISIHTPSGNCNTESVNTHIKIHPVAILELLLVWWQLIQAETDYDKCFHENLDYMPKSEF